MKNSRLPVLFLTVLVCLSAFAADVLTQQDITRLLELKIPEQTIIEKVNASGTAYVLGANDIARLKKAGASDALIAAMQSNSAIAGAGSATSEVTDLALIVDYSGSMNAKMKDGATKVASAKKCMADLVDKLPNDLNVTLVVYGVSKARGCEDIDIAVPLGPINKPALKAKIAALNASGMTPIASSLTKAGEELKKAKGGSAIVLVTDGAESCHGDPAGVAAKLATEFGVKFGINVIGFGIEPKERAELASIAEKGHGKLLTVENASELAGALQKVVTEKVAVMRAPTPSPTPQPTPTPIPTPTPTPRETKEYEAGGQAVKPGIFFGDAAMAAPGDYKGGLAMGEAKYYQVNLHKGQELRAIGIVQKSPYEGGYYALQTFIVTVYNKDLAQVAREKIDVDGKATDPATVRATWTADVDGPAYIAIAASDNHDKEGRPHDARPDNPKPSPYTLKIKVEGESAGGDNTAVAIAHTETAGGAGFNAAVELKVPALATSDIKLEEVAFYKFAVKKGDPVEVEAALQKPRYDASLSNGGIVATFTLTLYDDDQVQVAQKKIAIKNNPPDAQTIAVSWPAAMSGKAYATVSVTNSGGEILKSFQPGPGRVSIQVSTGEVAALAGEVTKPESNGSTPSPDGGQKPSPAQPVDPFAGAAAEDVKPTPPASPSP